MKFSIRPVFQTYVIAFVTIFLFAAATNIQGGWLFVIDALLISLLAFSFYFPISQSKKLTLFRRFNSNIMEGEIVNIELQAINNSKRTISFFNVKDSLPFKKIDKSSVSEVNKTENFFLNLEKNNSTTYIYQVVPKIRGVYTFGNIEVTFLGPFGLFKYKKMLELKNEVVVYPELYTISNFSIAGVKGLAYKSSSKTKVSVDSSLPHNIRDYRRGDSPKLIHWKASARNSKLMVKEMESEQSVNVQILLDTEINKAIGIGEDNSFEGVLKCAGSLFKHCIDKEYGAELIYFDENKLKRLDEKVTNRQLMDSLAFVEPISKLKLRELLQDRNIIKPNSVIIPVFLNIDLEDIKVLDILFKENYYVIPIFVDISSFGSKDKVDNSLINKIPFKFIQIIKGEKVSNLSGF